MVDVIGKCNETGKLSYIDITANSGAQILAKSAIHKQEGDILVQLPLSLNDDIEGLEVRVYVSEDSNISIERVNIYPADSEVDEEDNLKTIEFEV